MSRPIEYFVRWRNYGESCRVLQYDRQRQVFTPTPYFDPHLERIVTDTEIAFLIDGEYILFLQTNGMLETGLVSSRVGPNEFPRLEFCRQEDSVAEILATVSRAGILRVPDLREGEFDPSQEDGFNFFDAIQISRAGLVAASIREIQLLTEDAGRYVEADDTRLIAPGNTKLAAPDPAEIHLLVDDAGRNISTDNADILEVHP